MSDVQVAVDRPAMWGVTMTFGVVHRGWSASSGSLEATSRIAPPNLPVPGRGYERRLVEDVAPADVDEPGIRSDGVEDRLTHGVSRGGRQRRRDEHVVRFTHDLADLIEANDLLGKHAIGVASSRDTEPPIVADGGVGLDRKDADTEPIGQAGDLPPDRAIPDDRERPASQPVAGERHPRGRPRAQFLVREEVADLL